VDGGCVGAGERGHRRAAHLASDPRDRLGLADGCGREPGLDDVDAEVRERLRDEELCVPRERRARRLLAVAQGRVEDGDLSHLPAADPTGSRLGAGAACCGTSRRGSHGIISRSLRPTCSIGWFCSFARCAYRFGAPLWYSAIHFFACVPSLMSRRTLRISWRTRASMIRGPTV